MSKNRTKEFFSIVHMLQSDGLHNGTRQISSGSQSSSKEKQALFAKEFMRCARDIGTNLSSTYSKLEKLTILSKQKSIFDDRSAEIESLSRMIRSDITELNEQISKLQNLSKHGGTVPATPRHHLESHSHSVVIGLQSKLAKMSTNFKEVLEIRTENMKHQQDRRQKYSNAESANGYIPSRPLNSILLQPELTRGDTPVAIDIPEMDLTRRTPHHQQLQLIDEQDAYIQSRSDAMQNIESTIVELGGIFQQLAHMVKEQEEVVQRIDMHVEDADANIEAAHDELLRYFRSISSNRWLMAKVFGVLLIFFLFFVIFFA